MAGGQYGQPIPYSTVHEWVRYRLQAKLKRPRPSHPKKRRRERAIRRAARTSGKFPTRPRASPAEPRAVRVWWQDESRLGLHLPLPRRLTAQGIKPIQPHQPLYQYYWLYAAVEPATGQACWWEMPALDSPCFEGVLQHFGEQCRETLNVLVVDNAPAHTAKALQLPRMWCYCIYHHTVPNLTR